MNIQQNNVFKKPPLTTGAQLDKLRARGIIIEDEAAARKHLSFISYYRFCGYAIEFEDKPVNGEKRYHSGTTFGHIIDRYIFDRKLRLLVIDAIERIEIAIRTVMTNTLALKYNDAHWYLNKELFLPTFKHDDLIQSIKKETQFKAKDGSVRGKKRERFIKHYYDKYEIPELPAVWMVAEIVSLGSWSIIYDNLADRQDQQRISRQFGIDCRVMGSWLHALTYLRNLCAHHSKLWNRNFTLKPLIANKFKKQLKNNGKFSAQAAILKIYLDVISPGSKWAENLIALIQQHPNIDTSKMGLEDNWMNDHFWRSSVSVLTT